MHFSRLGLGLGGVEWRVGRFGWRVGCFRTGLDVWMIVVGVDCDLVGGARRFI